MICRVIWQHDYKQRISMKEFCKWKQKSPFFPKIHVNPSHSQYCCSKRFWITWIFKSLVMEKNKQCIWQKTCLSCQCLRGGPCGWIHRSSVTLYCRLNDRRDFLKCLEVWFWHQWASISPLSLSEKTQTKVQNQAICCLVILNDPSWSLCSITCYKPQQALLQGPAQSCTSSPKVVFITCKKEELECKPVNCPKHRHMPLHPLKEHQWGVKQSWVHSQLPTVHFSKYIENWKMRGWWWGRERKPHNSSSGFMFIKLPGVDSWIHYSVSLTGTVPLRCSLAKKPAHHITFTHQL